MIYSTPAIAPALRKQLDELSGLREALGEEMKTPGRWMGSLRREVRAASIESSTSIEGFSVSLGEALALTSGREAADRDEESRQAVSCYARAIDHVGTMAEDPSFRWLDRVILDLHFDACHFQREKDPGLWRTGPIGVTGADGTLEFHGPDESEVVPLMAEVIEWLAGGDLDVDVVIRGAMAHLHVVSVHPFRDGNGRVSRIVQSLVLARAGLTSPEFFSIEEYLGSHTQDYYAALREAQGGSYQPGRDASGWVGFCVRAHIVQARQRLAQIEQAATRWGRLEELVTARGWPERIVIALEQSLYGGTERSAYAEEADVSAATASADLRRLLDAGLVEQRGRGRNIGYVAGRRLREMVADSVPRPVSEGRGSHG
ncbi:MAG TPA: Fic family protein [Solirubrobacterales bacterium]|jgi:Fic family protein|nr:Fic family protein [Solirubrobacterales bacterium]